MENTYSRKMCSRRTKRTLNLTSTLVSLQLLFTFIGENSSSVSWTRQYARHSTFANVNQNPTYFLKICSFAFHSKKCTKKLFLSSRTTLEADCIVAAEEARDVFGTVECWQPVSLGLCWKLWVTEQKMYIFWALNKPSQSVWDWNPGFICFDETIP